MFSVYVEIHSYNSEIPKLERSFTDDERDIQTQEEPSPERPFSLLSNTLVSFWPGTPEQGWETGPEGQISHCLFL